MKTQTKWAAMKITRKSHEAAQKLLKQVSIRGWASYGADRDDVPTMGGIIEECIRQFELHAAQRAKLQST
jgi:hypothetical protein